MRCELLTKCAHPETSLPRGTPTEIDLTSAYLHYPLSNVAKLSFRLFSRSVTSFSASRRQKSLGSTNNGKVEPEPWTISWRGISKKWVVTKWRLFFFFCVWSVKEDGASLVDQSLTKLMQKWNSLRLHSTLNRILLYQVIDRNYALVSVIEFVFQLSMFLKYVLKIHFGSVENKKILVW